MTETKRQDEHSGSPDCSLSPVDQLLSALYLMVLQHCKTKVVRGNSRIYFLKSELTSHSLALSQLLEHGKIDSSQIVE